jgi:hypothetical protein
MKKFLTFSCLSILLLLTACGGVRQSLIDMSESDMKNAEATRVIARNLLSTWKLNSGFIRGSLGEGIKELPVKAVDAIDELDALADKVDPDDFDLGYSLGLRIRMLSQVVMTALQQYAPDVLKYIPAAFGL